MSYRTSLCAVFVFLLVAAAGPATAAPAHTEAIFAKIKAAGDAETHDADAVVVFHETDVLVRDNGIGTARRHQVLKILREPAIRAQAVQRFGFDPNTNRLDLVAVRVYRADGTVEEIPVQRAVVQPEPAGSIFWGTRQYLVQLPPLAVGDAIETISDMTGFNVAYLDSSQDGGPERNAYGEVLKPPVEGHWHDQVNFWTTGYPILSKRYTVRVPRDKPLQYEMYNGAVRPTVTFDDEHITYSFEVTDLAPLDGEPHQEPWPNVAPKLLLATLPTWEDKARWLYEVSEPQFDADDAIRQKVAEIIDGLETDEEKYTALNHWVAENIRYAGTSRGMCEGYTVHKSVETFHDRCGVCKDKAGMLVTMLRVAGYDSFLVMTMARQRVDPIPADQFNHAVTCIRWPDGSLKLLDPTWMPDSRDNWSTLEPRQHVVYGLPEGKELSTSPYFPPEQCKASWIATSTLASNNKLTGSLDWEACGAPEGRLRRTLSRSHPDERPHFFAQTFQRLSPNAQVRDVTYVHPKDFSQPLRIDADYEVPNYALGGGARRYFKLPMLQTVFGDRTLYDLLRANEPEERKYGVTLLATRLAHFEETIKLPPGWAPTNLPAEVDLDGPAAGLRLTFDNQPGAIRYTCELRVKKWLVPPDEYDNFKEVMDEFEALADHVVICELEGAHAQR